MHEKLREVAAALGQTPATVASIAIGSYVATQHRSLGAIDGAMTRMVEGVVEEAGKQMRLIEADQPRKAKAPLPARKGKA